MTQRKSSSAKAPAPSKSKTVAPAKKAAKPAAKPAAAPAKKAPTPAAKPAVAPAKEAPKASLSAADISALLSKIEEKAKRAGVKLPKGASAGAIAKLEKRLGFALPEDVRAFYLAHDGGPKDMDGFIDGERELLSVARIASEWGTWKELLDNGTFGENNHGEPGRGVQKKWWIAEWVPVSYDGSGNHHVVDVAPAPRGKHGQIVDFWHDEASRKVVAPSFLAWLASPKTKFEAC